MWHAPPNGEKGADAIPENRLSESGRPLAAHMVAAMDAADALWDGRLSPAFRDGLAEGIGAAAGGAGGHDAARALFRWLAALSGLGRCTPGYQALCGARFSGGGAAPVPIAPRLARHDRATSLLTAWFLRQEGWTSEAAEWAGYAAGGWKADSAYASEFASDPGADSRAELGGEGWRSVQWELFQSMTSAAGVPLEMLARHVPPVGVQLACSGAVILADRLAAQEEPPTVFGASPGPPSYTPRPDARADRSPVRAAALEAAFEAESPFLMVVDLPADEGAAAASKAAKASVPSDALAGSEVSEGIDAAFAAAEVMAAKFGLDGFFYALPTRTALEAAVDRALREHPGSLKGVGTLDQLRLDQADTGDPRVMLRQLTLVTRAVIIDATAVPRGPRSVPWGVPPVLGWLGRNRVPVVLMAAGLPEGARGALFAAYTGDGRVRPRRAAPSPVFWAPASQGGARAA
ncbi:CRISPR-associated helicase/endonuclease Cas3 [Nocardiopsis halophila]|uniref:CRISPR-associated helicase/endonuclease Cas3 n=1 Tax=Nocardiopsis halophila TaxID=141692 RepID=UPI0023AA1C00|nr:HD domain-containing protein [Nocardiopsis halophila]